MIALAKVLMKLAETRVIQQHFGRLLKNVEPANLALGTPDAATLIVRTGWACEMAPVPKGGPQGVDDADPRGCTCLDYDFRLMLPLQKRLEEAL